MIGETTIEVQVQTSPGGAGERFEPDLDDDAWLDNPSVEWSGRGSNSQLVRFAEEQLGERLPYVLRHDGVRGARIRVWSRGGPPDDEPDVVVTTSNAEICRARVEATIAGIGEAEEQLAAARAAMRRALADMAFHREGSKNGLASAVRPVWARRLVLAYLQGYERLEAIADALHHDGLPAGERDQLRFGVLLLQLHANGTITVGIDWSVVDIEFGPDEKLIGRLLRALRDLGVRVVDDRGSPVTDLDQLQPRPRGAPPKVLVDEETFEQLRRSSKASPSRRWWPSEPNAATHAPA